MFTGSIVALVTPFKDGFIDEVAFRKLLQFHIANGTDGILIAGCTGEAATITLEELVWMVDIAHEVINSANRRVQLLAGTGTNSTRTSIERTIAVDSKVDGLLLITPYYNKPTPAGQIVHFSEIAKHTHKPVLLYNVPGRTGTKMMPETIAVLGKVPNIVAVKEASGDLDAVSQLKIISDISVLSGDDTLTLPMMAVGATGVISVTANIDPVRVKGMCAAWMDGNWKKALQFHSELFPLSKAMFVETNPGPVKTALSLMGMIHEEFRLPLVPVKTESKDKVREALIHAKILKD